MQTAGCGVPIAEVVSEEAAVINGVIIGPIVMFLMVKTLPYTNLFCTLFDDDMQNEGKRVVMA